MSSNRTTRGRASWDAAAGDLAGTSGALEGVYARAGWGLWLRHRDLPPGQESSTYVDAVQYSKLGDQRDVKPVGGQSKTSSTPPTP